MEHHALIWFNYYTKFKLGCWSTLKTVVNVNMQLK